MLENTLTERAAAVKQLVNTHSHSVLSSSAISNASSLQPCSHEEADIRIILHISYFTTLGIKRMIGRTTDMDVIMPAVANVQKIPATEISVAFGVRKNFSYIPALKIASQLGPRPALVLPMFHALTV